MKFCKELFLLDTGIEVTNLDSNFSWLNWCDGCEVTKNEYGIYVNEDGFEFKDTWVMNPEDIDFKFTLLDIGSMKIEIQGYIRNDYVYKVEEILKNKDGVHIRPLKPRPIRESSKGKYILHLQHRQYFKNMEVNNYEKN